MDYVFQPPVINSLEVIGSSARFAVRRIYCVGRNYSAHVREMNKGIDNREPPFFFQKPADALVQSGSTIAYPLLTRNLHHEVELVVALGKGGTNIRAADALGHVFGYAVGVDLTRRDLQAVAKEKSWPWESAKAFDHSAPIGPIAAVKDHGHCVDRPISMSINGHSRQSANTSDMTWRVADVISKLSESFELHTGDLIMTGTPEGVGAIEKGDEIIALVEGLPQLTFTVS
jgi:fumarylpyruvate hydrolase